MNLHGIVSGAIGAVNPFITVQLKRSTGFTKSADFKQVPGYADPVSVQVQKQELTYKDLQQVNALNIQGVFTTVYLNGVVKGVDRATQTGGDMFVIDGQEWLVVAIAEQWNDWCKAILCLQVSA
jgi:hypothetical protein